MKKTKSQRVKPNSNLLESNKVLVPFIVIFAVIGVALILKGLAASVNVSIEPEKSVLATNATTGTDSTASGGSYVQFHKPSDAPLPFKAAGNTDPLPTKVIFDDEFNSTNSATCNNASCGLDKIKWAPVWFSDGSNQNGTVMKAANVSVSGGNLNLLINSSGQGSIISTNPAASNGQAGYTGFQYSHGYAEARICLPASPTPANAGSIANWPAWWTDGQNWPTDGEQDIMEGLSGGAGATWHGPTQSVSQAYARAGSLTGCHIFASNWQNGSVTAYYDGVKQPNNAGQGVIDPYVSSNITSAPQYLILENSNGSAGGNKVNSVTMTVDYVRVWQ